MIFLGLLLALSQPALAADWSQTFKADSALLYRDISGLSKERKTFDGFFVGNYRLEAGSENLRFEMAPEFRALVSPGVTLPPSDPASSSVRGPRRFLDLELELHRKSGSESYVDFDRLNAAYRSGPWELFAGRRPLSLGVLRFMPVWNKFSRPLPLAVGIPLVFSSDQLAVRWQEDQLSLQGVGVFGEKAFKEGVQIGTATYYFGDTEAHVLAGSWFQHPTAGLAIAQDIAEATFRLEAIRWWNRSGWAYDPEAQLQAGAGAEYAFTEDLSANSEFFYLSRPGVSLNRMNPGLRSRWYGLAFLNYQLSAFTNTSVGIFKNLTDPSQFWLFRLKQSLSDSMDLELSANIASGKSGSEFSRRSYLFPGGTYIGATSSAQLQVSLAL